MFYKLVYFRISRQNSSMEGTEVGIFIKASAWIHLFLLKIKIQQNASYPRKEHNTIFKHIHQNIRAYPRSKKICIDQWLWKYYCLSRRVRAKRDVGEQVWFVPNTCAGLRGNVTSEIFDYFYSHLSVETVFPALKLIQNHYINVNTSFPWKLAI